MTMTQQHELLAWLGDDWTDEQISAIGDDLAAWEHNNPDADDELREAVLTAIAQRVAGDLDLTALGEADRRAQSQARRTRLAVKAAVLALDAAGLIGPGRPHSESGLAAQLGVDRMTVRRKWRGLD